MSSLINRVVRADGQIFSTFKTSSESIVHTLKSSNPYVKNIKIVKCDKLGNPQKLIDRTPSGTDVYVKAEDGSSILKAKGEGKKDQNLAHIIFNVLCERAFK